jgi:hypothetical protein
MPLLKRDSGLSLYIVLVSRLNQRPGARITFPGVPFKNLERVQRKATKLIRHLQTLISNNRCDGSFAIALGQFVALCFPSRLSCSCAVRSPLETLNPLQAASASAHLNPTNLEACAGLPPLPLSTDGALRRGLRAAKSHQILTTIPAPS